MDQADVKSKETKKKKTNTSANTNKKKTENVKKEEASKNTKKQTKSSKVENANKNITPSKRGRKPGTKNNVKKNESKVTTLETKKKTKETIGPESKKNGKEKIATRKRKKISEMVPDLLPEEDIENEEENINKKEEKTVSLEENIDEIGKNIKEKRKLPKKDVKEMRRKYMPNLIMALAVAVFFGLIVLGFYKIQSQTFIIDLKTFGMLILLIAIILLENAYSKKDKIILAYGLECIVIATLTISLIYAYLKIIDKFIIITLIITAVFVIYYIIKYFIIRSKCKKNYFRDKMKEIIEKDEDTK